MDLLNFNVHLPWPAATLLSHHQLSYLQELIELQLTPCLLCYQLLGIKLLAMHQGTKGLGLFWSNQTFTYQYTICLNCTFLCVFIFLNLQLKRQTLN